MLLNLPVYAQIALLCGAPQPLLAPPWFELPVFALEIIDLACHVCQITLELSHVFVDLPQLEHHLTQPLLDDIAIGLLLQRLLNLP
jgi:hypothetical protein